MHSFDHEGQRAPGAETRLQLHPKAVWVDPAELDEDTRSRLPAGAAPGAATGAVAGAEGEARPRILTLSHGRGVSMHLAGAARELLELFAEPRTLVDAVVILAERREHDAEALLESALPVVERCYRRGILRAAVEGERAARASKANNDEASDDEASVDETSVDETSDHEARARIAGARGARAEDDDSEESPPVRQGERRLLPARPVDLADGAAESELPSWSGAEIEIVRQVQADRDTAVFLVRSLDTGEPAALKLYRVDDPGVGSLSREARALRALASKGGRCPRCLAEGILGREDASTEIASTENKRTETGGDGWPFLLTEWIGGVSATTAAAEARRSGPSATLALLREVASAFADLHGRGWLHGDVHPGNILVDAAGRVRLIDLALARPVATAAGVGGGGEGVARRPVAPFYMEPENAASLLAGVGPVAPSPLGEQAALGAVLFELATGNLYFPFSLARQALLREVATVGPRSFAEVEAAPWPALEAVLGRALARRPEARYRSVEALAAALAELGEPNPTPTPDSADAGASSVVLPGLDEQRAGGPARCDERVMARLGLEGNAWSFEAGTFTGDFACPAASVQHGAAGIGYAFLRMARQRQEPARLALAELWTARAASLSDPAGALFPVSYYPGSGWDQHELGAVGPFHARPGLFVVQAELAAALGDRGAVARATTGFVEAVRRADSGLRHGAPQESGPCGWEAVLAPIRPENVGRAGAIDLALGSAGTLLAAARLRCIVSARAESSPSAAVDALDELGHLLSDALLAAMAEVLGRAPARGEGPGHPEHLLGLAHGWGGLLYAVLAWHARPGGRPCSRLPSAVVEPLVEGLERLADQAEPWGRGSSWPWVRGRRRRTMSGWCNGGAGLVYLWSLAGRLLADERWVELAASAARGAIDHGSTGDSLCCGTLGRAYAALHLYQLRGGAAGGRRAERWLARARHLASTAADRRRFGSYPARSLYKGELAVAVLAADLEAPETAEFPFLELPAERCS